MQSDIFKAQISTSVLKRPSTKSIINIMATNQVTVTTDVVKKAVKGYRLSKDEHLEGFKK